MTRLLAALVCLTLLLAGCRTQPHVNAHIESVNAEYRELEDYVYSLEDEVARLQQELAAVKAGRVAPGAASGGTTSGGIFRRRPANSGEGPAELNPPRIESTPATEAPIIEIPGTESTLPPPAARSEVQRPGDEQPAAAIAPVEPERLPAMPADERVTHLALNPLQTGGADFDGQPGDDGVRIVVEPRNAADEFVPLAGPVSIALLDPARQGDAARVARWDFDLSATRQMLAAAAPGRGIKLELPWPGARPTAERLRLFVRYETADGRKLQTDREIHLAPPGAVAASWTPRPGPPIASAPAVEPTGPAPVAASAPVAIEPASLSAATASTPAPPAALSAERPSPPARPRWSPHR